MKFLTYKQLHDDLGLPWSRVHLRRLEAAGKFPRRVRLGYRTVAWNADEIDEWAEARAARSTGAA